VSQTPKFLKIKIKIKRKKSDHQGCDYKGGKLWTIMKLKEHPQWCKQYMTLHRKTG
jgi:hypothetical protein